jgi:hypothetical protein
VTATPSPATLCAMANTSGKTGERKNEYESRQDRCMN